jgi:hypothetical protein
MKVSREGQFEEIDFELIDVYAQTRHFHERNQNQPSFQH